MPLDRLIDLLAEAAVRKLSQEREKQEATPDAMETLWRQMMKKGRRFLDHLNALLTLPNYHTTQDRRTRDDCRPLPQIRHAE
ncbi:hypothetical protein JSE7799_01438 [Jannaschia seosinensis]|uniref:Uncharacterized protein n=1 Tax=Jannaschia seosinensis TaxID=313367 RepID=A0A0M7B947_9RHOB|nr:hypothetical protein JSE7799_01438 [Jannaschia seosinensis]